MNRDWYLREYPILQLIKAARPLPSQQTLEAIEKATQSTLPAAYRDFLLHLNGGVLCDSLFDEIKPCVVYDRGEGKSRVDIFSLSWADESASHNSIMGCCRIFRNRLPRQMIPIAHSSNSCLLISCRPEDYEFIYDFDRTFEVMKLPEQNIWRVADSLDAFLRQITPLDTSIEP